MKHEVEDLEELASVPLGQIMDEAVAAVPRIAYYRIRTKAPGHDVFTSGLVLCAAKGAPFYDDIVGRDSQQSTVPASQMRMRTIGAALRQTAGRMHDICCLTTEPELCLFATVNPATIDHLESLMADI